MKGRIKPFLLHSLFFLATFIFTMSSPAQPTGNTDESKVGSYTLPPLLKTESGKDIKTRQQWEMIQRPRILRLFADNVFGRMPGKPKNIHYKLNAVDESALNGKAIRKEITIFFTKEDSGPFMTLLLYLPRHSNGKVPVLVGLNFDGNHTI